MGYDTTYNGELEIDPPLSQPEYYRLLTIAEFSNQEYQLKQANADVFNPVTVSLTPADEDIRKEIAGNGSYISFYLRPEKIESTNETEHGYYNDGNLQLVAKWLHINGHKLTGSINWDGDGPGDTGTIYAEPNDAGNRVEFVPDVSDNPGPSWGTVMLPTDALKAFLSTIENTGGLIDRGDGTHGCAEDPDWIDLADAALKAKQALDALGINMPLTIKKLEAA